MSHQVKIFIELRKNKAEFLYEWLKKHYDALDIKKWEKGEKCSKEEEKRLEEIQSKKDCLALFEK